MIPAKIFNNIITSDVAKSVYEILQSKVNLSKFDNVLIPNSLENLFRLFPKCNDIASFEVVSNEINILIDSDNNCVEIMKNSSLLRSIDTLAIISSPENVFYTKYGDTFKDYNKIHSQDFEIGGWGKRGKLCLTLFERKEAIIKPKTEHKEESKDETDIEIFKVACENGQTEIVNLLLQKNKIEPNLQDNYGLRIACENGYTGIVKLLLDTNDVEPDTDNNYCIKIACKLGFIEIVSLLLESNKIDTRVDNNYPLNIATENFHYDIVNLLTKYQQQFTKDETLSLNEEKKYKKSRIPKVIKDGIWDYYIGNDVASVKCPCCQDKVITMRDFVAGHILSERNGGTITISNLIPICSKCNGSMGTRHLVEFTQTHWNRKPVLLKNQI